MGEPATGLSGIVVYPGRDVRLVLLLADKGADLPLLLSGIARCAGRDVELLNVWTTRGELVDVILLSASCRSEGCLEPFLACLGGLEGVKAVDSAPGLAKGLAVESWGFPVLQGARRVLVLDSELFGSMLRESWRLLGRSLLLPLYNASFAYGRELARGLRDLGLEGRSLLVAASEVLRHMGLGKVFWESVADSHATVTVHGSAECSAMRGVAGFESSILKGLVAGIVGELWGVDRTSIEARETSCIARGDSVCRIELALRQKK